MNVRFGVGLTVGCCAFALWAATVPGEPAPDIAVRDADGASVKLSAYRQKKHVALLTGSSPADWADTRRRLAALDTVLLFEDGAAGTMLIDKSGIVRRVVNGRVLSGSELAQFVEVWQSGKAYFLGYCARCHGEDGDNTACVDKVLTGVGRRLSP